MKQAEIKIIVISFIIFILLDALFIYVNRNIFLKNIGNVLKEPIKLDLLSMIIAYSFLYGGFYFFIINQNSPIYHAFILGMVINGTYEFTNRSIIKDWPLYTSLIDTLWGGILFSTTTYLTYKIKNNDFKISF